jgi:lipopolysaccharide/colanic/teichoic acid biosynthesis glycosyltransferase
MLTHRTRWSHPPGNAVVPSGWQATLSRYADDFVVLSVDPVPMLTRCSARWPTWWPPWVCACRRRRPTHIDDGFDFLGWHIQRRTCQGRGGVKQTVYTYPSTAKRGSKIGGRARGRHMTTRPGMIRTPRPSSAQRMCPPCGGHQRVGKDAQPESLRLSMTRGQAIAKRGLDISAALVGLFLFGWIIALAWCIAALETRSNGFFTQRRVGRNGRLFTMVKIKTMRSSRSASTVTTRGDPRITRSGRALRATKIDEFPQLWNVLIGDMSLVGPRPDVAGFADCLRGEDRLVLSVRPGITGPASLTYRNEEQLLASVADPDAYNRNVVFPDKVRINLDYVRAYSFTDDLRILYRTVVATAVRCTVPRR